MPTPEEQLPGNRSADELPPPDDSTLWLVSFGETDDREMRAPEIAAAIRRGEIRGDTIVWREGLPEWVSIASVPVLARLLSSTGETRGAPAAVLGKIPLVRKEEGRPEGQSATSTPIGLTTPSSAATPIFGMRGAVGSGAVSTLQGPGGALPASTSRVVETGIRTTEERSAEGAAPVPAWKGRTRIGLPRMEAGAAKAQETPGVVTAATDPTATPSPIAAKLSPASDATATPSPIAAKPSPASDATATPSPIAAKSSAARTAADAPQPVAGKVGAELPQGPLEPQRPEARKIEAKGFGATPKTPSASVPRVVPKAAPAPALKTGSSDATKSSPKAAPASSPVAADVPKSSPKAAPASSPVATVPVSSPTAAEASARLADDGAAPLPGPEPTLPEASPERKAAAAPDSPRPGTPPAGPASPEPPKATEPRAATATPFPEPGRALPATATPRPGSTKTSATPDRQTSPKPDAPKGPPPRHRDAAPGPRPAARRADAPPTSARTGAGYIWDDDGDGPVSVDPESVRPPPPAHAIAEARANSLSPGLKKKATPRPPSPKRTPPPPAAETDEATLPLPVTTSEKPQAGPIASLDVPLVEEFAEASAPPLDTTPTVPREPKAGTASKPAPATSRPPAPAKRRSLFPFVLLGATAAAVTVTFLLRNRPPSEPVTATPEPVQTALPVEPTSAAAPTEPAVPAAPEPSAALEPSAAPVAATPIAATSATGATASPKAPNTTSPVVTPTQAMPASAKEPKPSAKEPKPETAPAPKEPKPVAAAPETQVDDVGGEFDRAAASAALGAAAGLASGCRKEGDPTGIAVVHVTFSNAGRATRALVEGPPFAGTATGGCIAEALRKVKVPPFGGDRVTVTKRVVIQ